MFDRSKLVAILTLNGQTLADFAGAANVSTNTLRLVFGGYAASEPTRRRLLAAYRQLEHHGLDAVLAEGERPE